MRSLGADLPLDSSLGRHLMSTGPVIKAVGGQLPRFAKRPVPPKSLVSRGLVAKRPSRPPAEFRLPATGRIIIVAAMRRWRSTGLDALPETSQTRGRNDSS